jgi:hypothetical protein
VDRKYPEFKVREIMDKWIDSGERAPDDVYTMIEEE